MSEVTNQIVYDEWFEELKLEAVKNYGFTKESAETICYESFKELYNDGLTPSEALWQDLLEGL